MGRTSGSMQRGCMLVRILAVCASVSTETGLFSVAQAEEKMREEYPDFFRIYSSKFASQISAAKCRGMLDEVFVEGLRATGLYRIPPATLDQVLDFIL